MSDPTSSTTPGKSKRLTEAEWTEAKTLYEMGRSTKTELANQYGVSRQAITNGLAARGAIYGSKSKAIEEATVEGQKTDARRRSEEVSAMKEKRLKSIDLIERLQNKVIGEALNSNQPLSAKNNEFRVINTILKNNAIIREELYALYDLNRDPDAGEEIPEFIVSEYTPDEIAALNNERLGQSPDEVLKALADAMGDEEPDEDDLGIGALIAGDS